MSRAPGRITIAWTPPALHCPDCDRASAAHVWAMEAHAARCPLCAALVDLADLDVTTW